ncbi:MAG: ankyrin repeat domain-containing protein [Candidatus Babeliales bacterium]
MQKIIRIALLASTLTLQAMDTEKASQKKTTLQDLCLAIRQNNYHQVSQLLTAGVDVRATLPETGDTALHVAFTQRQLNNKIIGLLLENGAPEATLNKSGVTPVGCILQARLTRKLVKAADHRGTKEKMTALLEQGAQVNGLPGEDMPLHRAIAWCSPEKVALLLEHGAHVKVNDTQNCSSLHVLAQARFDEEKTIAIAHMLLDAGACLEARTTEGQTPINLLEGREEWQPLVAFYKAYQASKK